VHETQEAVTAGGDASQWEEDLYQQEITA